MWKITFLILLNIISVLAGYYCTSPTDCTLYCNNVKDFSRLNETGWIIVPRVDDSCYFYNTIRDISIEP